MTETPDEANDRPRWLTMLHNLSMEQFRRSHEIASRTNLHEDTMLIWGIGLAGGAVYLAVQVAGDIEPRVTTLQLFVGVLPWVISAFTGVVARLLMPHLLLADDQVSHVRASDLALLPLRKGLADREFALKIVEVFEEPKEGLAVELAQKANKWAKRVRMWSMTSQVCLAVGILWFPGMLVLRLVTLTCGRHK